MPPKLTALIWGLAMSMAGTAQAAYGNGYGNGYGSGSGGSGGSSAGSGSGSSGGSNSDGSSGQQTQTQQSGNSTGATTTSGGLDCSFQGSPFPLTDSISFQHILNQVDNTLTVEVTYQGTGWLGFGVSADGFMIGSQVVIAMPDQAQGSTNPGKYSIADRSPSAITLMPQQTLMNASFDQTGGVTVLRFTKAIAENGELAISADGSNTFVYAAGGSNTFAYHAQRGSVVVPSLNKCVQAGQSPTPTTGGQGGSGNSGIVVSNNIQSSQTQTLWAVHGILMFISWGILIPIAIGCSLIRRLVPGNGTWFQLHRAANGIAFLLMTAAFGIAIYNVKANHFAKVRHRTVGLVIYVLTFLQVLGGIFRPHLPHAPPKQVEPDVEADQAMGPSDGAHETPKKSTRRVVFEVLHRTFGFGLLGLSWYNLYLGIGAIVGFYGASYDLSSAMWGVIGGISGLILVLFVYTKAVPEKKE